MLPDGFSTEALLTSWVGYIFAVGAFLCVRSIHQRMATLSSIPGVYPQFFDQISTLPPPPPPL